MLLKIKVKETEMIKGPKSGEQFSAQSEGIDSKVDILPREEAGKAAQKPEQIVMSEGLLSFKDSLSERRDPLIMPPEGPEIPLPPLDYEPDPFLPLSPGERGLYGLDMPPEIPLPPPDYEPELPPKPEDDPIESSGLGAEYSEQMPPGETRNEYKPDLPEWGSPSNRTQ